MGNTQSGLVSVVGTDAVSCVVVPGANGALSVSGKHSLTEWGEFLYI